MSRAHSVQHRSTSRRLAIAVACGLATLAGATASARADSSTIAGDPTVVPGQEQFGNFTGDAPISDVWVASYWGLQVIAGDRVSIAYSGDSTEQGAFELYVDKVGTPDGLGIDGISFAQITSGGLSASGDTGTVRFTAPTTGRMPLAFTTGSAYEGPYTFTVSQLHRVDMQLPGVGRIARSGRLRIQAHDPDGVPLSVPGLRIDLQERSGRHGRWHTIGHAAPRDGTARVSYHLPGSLVGRVVQLRAEGSGGGYFTIATAGRRVAVA